MNKHRQTGIGRPNPSYERGPAAVWGGWGGLRLGWDLRNGVLLAEQAFDDAGDADALGFFLGAVLDLDELADLWRRRESAGGMIVVVGIARVRVGVADAFQPERSGTGNGDDPSAGRQPAVNGLADAGEVARPIDAVGDRVDDDCFLGFHARVEDASYPEPAVEHDVIDVDLAVWVQRRGHFLDDAAGRTNTDGDAGWLVLRILLRCRCAVVVCVGVGCGGCGRSDDEFGDGCAPYSRVVHLAELFVRLGKLAEFLAVDIDDQLPAEHGVAEHGAPDAERGDGGWPEDFGDGRGHGDVSIRNLHGLRKLWLSAAHSVRAVPLVYLVSARLVRRREAWMFGVYA